jgi:RHS repeat-associated protein
MYFGARPLKAVDRLGSVRNNGNAIAYYPWGEERTSTADGTDKFATYFRDTFGQDYANARYYNSNLGRFWSPNPKGHAAADPENPMTWNRYAYANDDPSSQNDPSGLDTILEPMPYPSITPGECSVGAGEGIETVFCELISWSIMARPNLADMTQSAYPECNPSGNKGIEAKLDFIDENYADASELSAMSVSGLNSTAIPADWILGWAALESNWGATALTSGQNPQFTGQYFGWGGAGNGNMTCPAGAGAGFACFASFWAAAATSLFSGNNYFIYNGQIGVSMAAVLEDALASGLSESAAFQNVANTGYVGDNDPGKPQYGAGVTTRTRQIDPLLDCLKRWAYLN